MDSLRRALLLRRYWHRRVLPRFCSWVQLGGRGVQLQYVKPEHYITSHIAVI